MTDAFDSGNEKLAVTHDRITGGAYFYFRGKQDTGAGRRDAPISQQFTEE